MRKMIPRRLRRQLRGRVWLAALAVGLVGGLGWWAPQSGGILENRSPTVAVEQHQPQELTELLASVQVIDALPEVQGYQRGCGRDEACVFGAAWNDPNDHSGCDTRSRILRDQLSDVVIKPGTNGCKVLAGRFSDPYTGQVMEYSRGESSNVNVDHIFSLSRAWDSGAWSWPLELRVQFANDPDNLLVVSASANREKSDAGLEWLPDNPYFRCTFVSRYLSIAVKYSLPITLNDHATAETACPSVVSA
ncbi:hypothetical protein FIV07_28110 (plasmid) [Mycobacterium sp. THAF192]|nr:hypothetical protein FIV07_28110 [Mycobacterium sp. THAF192]